MTVIDRPVLRNPSLTGASFALDGDQIFVRDYVVACNVGVYAEEHGVTQTVRFNVAAALAPDVRSTRDDMSEVPSYTDIIAAIDDTAASGHIQLVETFAERIAELLLRDPRLRAVRIRLEKLERGPARGVEIVRERVSH
jgi:dihydroneopterin aldolase